MKIIYCANGDRGLECLKALLSNNLSPLLVIAHPTSDRNSIVELALHEGISCIQPSNINDSGNVRIIAQLEPDLIILAGYGQIVKRPLIELAKIACINLHGGKLPEYRGSSPINWSILNGETVSACSIILVDEGIDTGDLIAEESFTIEPDDDALSIKEKTLKIFPKLLLDVLGDIEKLIVNSSKQNNADACYYPVRQPSDGLILWDQMTDIQVHNMVRALVRPFPGAYSYLGEDKIYFWKTHLLKDTIKGVRGTVYRFKDKVVVMCANRGVQILEVQREFDNPVPATKYFTKSLARLLTSYTSRNLNEQQ
ncbi:MAG: methionyl-tRNA formyltransferase [Ekhidna sp.]